ncbi:MerR family transcriptional regulator, partial [Enterocloster bolteae]|uniref:MerR family transcriptional regulator n=1 Tax=Enterocloster bolteae TaxID=208479 RepID=UPI003AB32C44
ALYNISTDILRYYEELGILVPRRAFNGYRIYRTEDLWCLNVIRDLRELGFSMEQIKAYIENRSIDSSLELFQKEMDVIDRHIERLISLRDNIITRRETISRARMLPLGTITLKEMPSRPCHRIMQSCETDDTSSMTRCSSFTLTASTASGRVPICRSATAATSARPGPMFPGSWTMPGNIP